MTTRPLAELESQGDPVEGARERLLAAYDRAIEATRVLLRLQGLDGSGSSPAENLLSTLQSRRDSLCRGEPVPLGNRYGYHRYVECGDDPAFDEAVDDLILLGERLRGQLGRDTL